MRQAYEKHTWHILGEVPRGGVLTFRGNTFRGVCLGKVNLEVHLANFKPGRLAALRNLRQLERKLAVDEERPFCTGLSHPRESVSLIATM